MGRQGGNKRQAAVFCGSSRLLVQVIGRRSLQVNRAVLRGAYLGVIPEFDHLVGVSESEYFWGCVRHCRISFVLSLLPVLCKNRSLETCMEISIMTSRSMEIQRNRALPMAHQSIADCEVSGARTQGTQYLVRVKCLRFFRFAPREGF
jgi:hypothetical protein